jgi:hypothetical protein
MACVAPLQQKRCASESRRFKFSDENADRCTTWTITSSSSPDEAICVRKD